MVDTNRRLFLGAMALGSAALPAVRWQPALQISRLDPDIVGQAFGVSAAALASLPPGETYIMQGDVLPLDGPEARAAKPHPASHTHRFALGSEKPVIDLTCGSVRAVSAREFPVSTTKTGLLIRLQPAAMQPPH